jgi:hypothetical protein
MQETMQEKQRKMVSNVEGDTDKVGSYEMTGFCVNLIRRISRRSRIRRGTVVLRRNQQLHNRGSRT